MNQIHMILFVIIILLIFPTKQKCNEKFKILKIKDVDEDTKGLISLDDTRSLYEKDFNKTIINPILKEIGIDGKKLEITNNPASPIVTEATINAIKIDAEEFNGKHVQPKSDSNTITLSGGLSTTKCDFTNFVVVPDTSDEVDINTQYINNSGTFKWTSHVGTTLMSIDLNGVLDINTPITIGGQTLHESTIRWLSDWNKNSIIHNPSDGSDEKMLLEYLKSLSIIDLGKLR